MINRFSHWVQLPARYVIAALLISATALTGCQKNTETATENTSQNTESQTANTPVIATADSANADSATTHQQTSMSQPLTILALGDSLTEGLGVAANANYPAQLQARLQEMGYENATVINSGLSGETSTGLVNRLDWVTQTQPDITILTIGANDAIRGIDAATVEANLRTAVQHLQDNGSQVILGGMQIYDNLGTDYVQAFAAIYPRVAQDMNVTLIPFFLENVGGDPTLNQADAIHPTSEGYTVIVNDNILPLLTPEIKKIMAAAATPTTLPADNAPNETKQ